MVNMQMSRPDKKFIYSLKPQLILGHCEVECFDREYIMVQVADKSAVCSGSSQSQGVLSSWHQLCLLLKVELIQIPPFNLRTRSPFLDCPGGFFPPAGLYSDVATRDEP